MLVFTTETGYQKGMVPGKAEANGVKNADTDALCNKYCQPFSGIFSHVYQIWTKWKQTQYLIDGVYVTNVAGADKGWWHAVTPL